MVYIPFSKFVHYVFSSCVQNESQLPTYLLFAFMQVSRHFLMAKKEMSSLLKGHQIRKTKADKFELEVKSKDAELKKNQLAVVKMEKMLKKNGEELEVIKKEG